MRIVIVLLAVFVLMFSAGNVMACATCAAHNPAKTAEKCACGFDKGSAECIKACAAAKAEPAADDISSEEGEESSDDGDASAEEAESSDDHDHEGHEDHDH